LQSFRFGWSASRLGTRTLGLGLLLILYVLLIF
jgi:hypothetical protein